MRELCDGAGQRVIAPGPRAPLGSEHLRPQEERATIDRGLV